MAVVSSSYFLPGIHTIRAPMSTMMASSTAGSQLLSAPLAKTESTQATRMEDPRSSWSRLEVTMKVLVVTSLQNLVVAATT